MSAPAWLLDTPIAHRGLHGPGVPELSRAALRLAAQAGCAVEVDVRASRDAVLLAVHDPDTARETGVHHVVAETDASVLVGLRLVGSDEQLLTLRDVLALVDGAVPLLLEVKHGQRAGVVGPLVMACLAGYRGPWAVESFDPRIVRWFARHAPAVARGQLSGDLSAEPLPLLRRVLLETMVLNVLTRPDFLVFDVDALPDRWVRLWQRVLRCPLVVWTACTADHLRLAASLGAGVIFEGVAAPALPWG